MNYTLSRHACDEMVRRGISASVVDAIMQAPQQIVVQSPKKQVYQSKIAFGNVMFLVRVVIAFDVDPPLVVTVYRTTKIDRYWV